MSGYNAVSDPYKVHQMDSAGSDDSEISGDSSLPLSRYTTNVDEADRQDERERSDTVQPLRGNGATSGPPPNRITNGLPNGSSITHSQPVTPPYLQTSTTAAPSLHTWSAHGQSRPRGGSASLNNLTTSFDGTMPPNPAAATNYRPQRPKPPRTPSHAYAPPRRPSQFVMTSQNRSNSGSKVRVNPDADYRAQKKAYVQRLQDTAEDSVSISPDGYPPGLAYSGDSEDEGSTSTADPPSNDFYDEPTLYYGNEESQPSAEELKIPANRERLEWHSMLHRVLTGDVVKQEKKRMTGGGAEAGDKSELWIGVRAKVFGRTAAAQQRVLEDQRSKIPAMIEDIASFEIKGETEVGKGPREQVATVVQEIEKLESLYPSTKQLKAAYPKAASAAFQQSCNAIVAWHNTTELINIELSILQSWVDNEELDFSKSRQQSSEDGLTDESSFIERVLKEDGLKSLQSKDSMLTTVENVIDKAKQTLIDNAEAFAEKHLPPYIEELLTLINFPSRLIQEIIRMRLNYSTKLKEEAHQKVIIAEEMSSQFQILLALAVRAKTSYLRIYNPEPGWDLPPCIDENFDSVVLDAMRFYFKMLNWRLLANKNTFKETEILEIEWESRKPLGRDFQGGDVVIADQFSVLTAKSLVRLTAHFEKELERRPNEVAGPEMDKRYKQILDSVRVRQRKLFRFSRLLTQTFENSTEYNIANLEPDYVKYIYDALTSSGHVLVNPATAEEEKLWILACPALLNRPQSTHSILEAAYHVDTTEPANLYVLILYPDTDAVWEGRMQEVDLHMPKIDVKPGKMRLVAEGTQGILSNANGAFLYSTQLQLETVIPAKANISSIDRELQRMRKTAYKLSNAIMDSVEIIRKQLVGQEFHDLIQTCFAFATEFGQRSLMYMDPSRRVMNNLKITRLALDWVSFICDDCIASERKTFKWAVVALEFAMMRTKGPHILSISDEEYAKLRSKVSGCMSLLISHFDIMGARSTVAAQAEQRRTLEEMGGKYKLDANTTMDDDQASALVQKQWLEQLEQTEEERKYRQSESKPVGRVLDSSTEADRSLTYLSASATNVTMRWQQGQYIGGGTFGSVWAAINIDSGSMIAVKEIRLQDPQLIPHIINQIKDEMGVLQILDHPNIVSYEGIEVHRDKVYIFMEYCSGGSLAALLEHGRIEDEMVITVYALQMLEGLAYLHESGVVHRDIKPENILLDHNGVIKFVDFGAAKVIARQSATRDPNLGRAAVANNNNAAAAAPDRGGRKKSMTGTPMYMSPEVIRGNNNIGGGESPTSPGAKPRPGAVDIWSLGCVVLEMATGRRPWATLDNEWAIMYNIAQGNPPQMPTREQLSDTGIDFLRLCFERDPSKRVTAAELLQHDWIMKIRNVLNIEPGTPGSSATSGGSGGGGGTSASGSDTGGSSGPNSATGTRHFGGGSV